MTGPTVYDGANWQPIVTAADAPAAAELIRQARAGAALYWATSKGPAATQSVFGTHRARTVYDADAMPLVPPPPEAYVNPGEPLRGVQDMADAMQRLVDTTPADPEPYVDPGDDTANGPWSTP